MNLEELSIAVNRINSSIQSEDRKKRKQVLGELYKLLTELHSHETQYAFECFQPALVRSLNDQSEAVRSAAVDILQEILPEVPINNKLLDDVIPIMLYRLGDVELREESEELRLKFIQLLIVIIEKYSRNLDVFIEDIVKILNKTLVDSYPKLRQESARCCKVLVQNIPQEMYHHGYKLVKAILANFKQNHFRTRILAIETLGDVMKDGNWKLLHDQEVFGSLGERLFDGTPGVRLAVVELLGIWLTTLRDRYSFFFRMIPLMLSCLDDVQADIYEKALTVWSIAGNHYAVENEQDLKDKMDFLDGKPSHYPKNVERPNIGCRTLVQRNILHVMKPLLSELEDWKSDIRVKASYLLVRLILHAEEDITQHSEYILRSMYTLAEKDDPAVVVENVEKAAEYMAYFVEPSSWHGLICPVLEEGVRLGHLRILSALCRGTRHGDLIDEYLDPLVDIISEKSCCCTREPMYQTQLLKCCFAILNNLDNIEEGNVSRLYFAIVNVCAIAGDNWSIVNAAQGVLETLAVKAGMTATGLARHEAKAIVEGIGKTVEIWTGVNTDLALLLYILKQPLGVWSALLDDITELLKIALKVDRDAAMRSQLFVQLTTILTDNEAYSVCGEEMYSTFLYNIIKEMICPNLVWRAGRTSEAVRTTVVACLLNVLEFEQAWTNMSATEILEVTLPPLTDCLRDNAQDTRLIALKCIVKVIRLADQQRVFKTDHVNRVYSEVLGRLDDVSNDVRAAAVDCLSVTYGHLPDTYTESEYRYHLETVVNTMLTHLDDSEEAFQNRLLECLKVVARRAPNVVAEKLSSRRHLFSAQHLCDDLQKYLDTL